MKKLLILMLVLGLASTANAVILSISPDSATVNCGESITVSVSSDTSGINGAYLAYIMVMETECGALSDCVIDTNAGDQAWCMAYQEDGWGTGFEIGAADTQGLVAAGKHFDFTFTCPALGEGCPCTATIDVYVDPDYDNPHDTLTVECVPEPMTIALLGLGGLFLRRRK